MENKAEADSKEPLMDHSDRSHDFTGNINAGDSIVDSFQFTEGNLQSEKISGHTLRKIIMEQYGFKQLTEETLRLLLKQGAEDNKLLRISEASYTKLMNALDIPLDDHEPQNTKELITHVACCGARTEVVNERTASIRQSLKNFLTEEENTTEDDAYLNEMLARRNTIKNKKNDLSMMKMTDAIDAILGRGDIVKADEELDKAYTEKETPGSFEATPAMTFVIVIFVISVFCFGLLAAVTYLIRREAYDIIGYGLLASRGAALSILVLDIFSLLFVSYDMLTWVRSHRWARRCVTLLDFNVYFHKICGYLIFVYAVIHTACHCSFTLTSFSNPDNWEHLNDALIAKKFKRCPTYLELLLQSIPGVTGIILMTVITIMFVCSLDKIRRKYFQLFSYVHMSMMPIFLIATFVHGADGWVNFGFPTSLLFLPIPIVIYFAMIIRRAINMKTKPFYVADASFSNNGNFMFLNLVKPKGYDFKPGQYAFINIPEISKLQWHPFSIASSPNNDFMVFMVQNSGDYTDRLLKYMYNLKKKSFDKSVSSVGLKYQQTLQDYMISMKICDISLDLVENNKKLFPKIYVSRPISAPAEMAALRRNLIFIGAGSGIAPFLAFLDDQQILARGGCPSMKDRAKTYRPDYSTYEKAHLIFISRDADQLSWLSPYLDQIMDNEDISDKFELHVYLTCKKKIDTLPSFLFWRAFNIREKQKLELYSKNTVITEMKDERDIITECPIHINLGRPNFKKLFEKIHAKNPTDHFVYGCAPPPIINSVKKECNEITNKTKDLFIFRYEHF